MFMASTAYRTSTLAGELIEKMNKLSPTQTKVAFLLGRGQKTKTVAV